MTLTIGETVKVERGRMSLRLRLSRSFGVRPSRTNRPAVFEPARGMARVSTGLVHPYIL
jgi:hypothetical protein